MSLFMKFRGHIVEMNIVFEKIHRVVVVEQRERGEIARRKAFKNFSKKHNIYTGICPDL